MGIKSDWAGVTPFLLFAVMAFSWGDLLFGIDTGSFGALQVLPSWLRSFGDLNPTTGVYSSPTSRTSLMNAIVFVGSFIGCAIFEPICERWGFKVCIMLAGVVQVIAVIVELTATNWIVFTVGRIIAYIGVGLVENATPGYCSEVSPAAIRGFMSGSMTVLVTVGNTIGVGMSLPFATEMGRIGWIIPTAIQLLPALGILAMVPFCPESPRWLISKGRDAEGLASLNRLRHKRDVDSGITAIECDALIAAVQESRMVEKGRWIDLLSKKYRRRTVIVLLLFCFYQTTGGGFVNVYGPTFYRQMGLGSKVFVYATLGQGIGIVSTIIAILLIDKLGRRLPIITGATMLVVCNVLIGTLGPKPNITAVEQNVVVASLILLLSGVKISFQCNAFLMTSEMGGVRMRKKFMGFGTTVDVIYRIVFTAVVPFFLNDPLYMGARFAFVMGGFALASWFFAVLMVPETSGRGLEEMDELFAMNMWPWEWKNAKTTGLGSTITALEMGRDVEMMEDVKDKLAVEHAENTNGAVPTLR